MTPEMKKMDGQFKMMEKNHDTYTLPATTVFARLAVISPETYINSIFKTHDARLKEIYASVMNALERVSDSAGFCFIANNEIVLALNDKDNEYGRNTRKLTSLLSSTASGMMSVLVSDFAREQGEEPIVIPFDCHIVSVPNDMADNYLNWRGFENEKMALNKKTNDVTQTPVSVLTHRSYREKINELFNAGVDYEDVPKWYRYGFSVIDGEVKDFTEVKKVLFQSDTPTESEGFEAYVEDCYPDGFEDK